MPRPPESTAPATDALVAESTRLFDRWRRRYASRPREERLRLMLLALEREQIVSITYRDDVIGARLSGLDVPPELRALMRRALLWAWRDEQLHTEHIRGLLLATHRPVPAGIVFGRQLLGVVSGWVVALRHHQRPTEAPARTAVAAGLIAVARLTGRIPPLLAGELRDLGVRRYLLLNVALERTAELAYARLAELARDAGDGAEADTFERIRADEAGHAAVFAVLAAALDPDDRLAPHADVGDLGRAIGEVSPWFVAADIRPADIRPADIRPADIRPADIRRGGDRPLGSGAPVVVHRGGADHDLATTVRRTLDEAGLADLVGAGTRVAVRAAFMYGYDRADRSNIVDPALVAAVAATCRAHGAADVVVLEARTVYDRYFANRSVASVAEYFGYDGDGYRLVDIDADQDEVSYRRGYGRRTISRSWRDADVRIVVAKLRSDPVEQAHLGICSVEGTAGGHDQTIHPGREVDFRSASMMTLDIAPPGFAVVDAWGPLAHGPFGVMGCHRPAHDRRVYAGRDALAVDAAVLADLGVTDPSRSPILRLAAAWFGVELGAPEVVGEPGPIAGWRGPQATPWGRVASWLGYPIYTYLSDHGRLFVPDMDTSAFPATGPVGPLVRFTRRGAQLAFGLRPPRPTRCVRPQPP